MSRWLVACFLCLAVLAPSFAEAQNPLIRQGQTQYEELRFEEALQTLSAALVRTGNTSQQYATIYRLLAFTYHALRRPEEASGAYRSMLPLVPEYVPDESTSPRTREFFGNVRTAWEEAGRPGVATAGIQSVPIEIGHNSPAEAEPETEVPLSATIEDPNGVVASLVLAYRQGTDAVFTRLDTRRQPDGEYHATIPAADVAPPLVEYYFEALNTEGLPVAARGDVAAPLRIAVAEGANLLEAWWFWTIIGVVVVGGVVGAILIADAVSGPNTGTFVITVE